MGTFLELFLFLGIFFPLYHITNIIPSLLKSNKLKGENKNRFISILVPCYNEEAIIKYTIDGILRMDYKNYECIIVDDGSKDNTLNILHDYLDLEPTKKHCKSNIDCKEIKGIYKSRKYDKIYCLAKVNGGKSDALNAGINYAKYQFVATMDADSILKTDALKIISKAFDDPDVVAASGVIQILQSFKLSGAKDNTTLKLKWLLKLQTIEYIKSCFCYKASLAKLNSLLVISGAFGVFRKDILLAVNGFKHVIGEDLDLTLKIQYAIENTNKKIVYTPNAICYTEGPESLKDFFKQRKRWQISFIESLFSFKHNIFNGIFTKSLNFFIVVDALFIGVISSFVIVIFSFLIFRNIINQTLIYVLIYLIIFVIVQLTYNIVGILVASHYGVKYKKWDKLRLILSVFLDIVVYRLIILCTIIVGSIAYFKEDKKWNKVNRSGRCYNVLKKE